MFLLLFIYNTNNQYIIVKWAFLILLLRGVVLLLCCCYVLLCTFLVKVCSFPAVIMIVATELPEIALLLLVLLRFVASVAT